MIRLLVVEDNERLRPALVAGIERTGKMRVTGSCPTGEQALEHCLAGPPQAVLMDVRLAGELNGIGAAVTIRREFPRLPVVFYSIQDDDAYYRAFRRSGILSHYATRSSSATSYAPNSPLCLRARSRDGCIFISRNSAMAKSRCSMAAGFSSGW